MKNEKKNYNSPMIIDLGDAKMLTAGSKSNGSEEWGVCELGAHWRNVINMYKTLS